MNNQLTIRELNLISNCILDRVLEIGHKQPSGYEKQIETLIDLRLKVEQLAGKEVTA